MIYCLNPDCKQPINVAQSTCCESCGLPLVPLLRGRYRIVRALGQGGFGKTYLAVDEDRLKARCVIKQFLPQVKSESSMKKAVLLFEQEAIRLNELGEHPHIPSLMAYFEQDNRLYLVQQFIEGATLAQELSHQGCFGEQKIREVMAGLLPILKFVHDRNVIHRDITPANIIRRKLDNRLILIDFGIAKVLEEVGSDLEVPGTKIGTAGYAPIEQLRSGRAFPASDLYSLGATCLYLMTRIKPDDLYDPIQGNWLWRSQLAEQGVRFSEGIGQILDRLLKDLVIERYQTADQVMHDLRTLMSRPSSLSPGSFSLPRSSTASIPRPTKPPEISRLPQSANHSNSFSNSEIRANSQGLNESDFVTDLPDRDVSSQSNQLSQANELSEAPSSSDPVSAKLLPMVDIRRSSPSAKSSPISSPTSNRISGELTDLYGCISTLKGHSSWVFALAASPDSQTLVSGGLDDRIIVWDLLSGDADKILVGHTKPINGLAITSNGKTVVSCSDDISIKFWQLSTGNLERSLSAHTRDINSIAVSSDGQFLVSGAEDRTLCVWNVNSGTLLRSYPEVSGMVRSVAMSANAQVVACGGLDNKVRVWNFNTTQLLHCFSGHNNSVLSVALTQSGQYVVSGSKDRTIKIWNVQSGELIRTLIGHLDVVNSVAITPDGRYLISGSGDKTIRIWHCASGEPIVTLTGHKSAVNAIVVSPNQKWLASASSDNSIKVWKLG
ncbi:MAG: serine/threonine protein kinase [Cyanobacteria bacterium]|nr:serine/threonine protein kinase [Cyanobacteriota bacterium]